MAIFLIATGPALALHTRLTEWRTARKHVSLIPQVAGTPCINASLSCNRTAIEKLRARSRGKMPKLGGPHNGPWQPPIV